MLSRCGWPIQNLALATVEAGNKVAGDEIHPCHTVAIYGYAPRAMDATLFGRLIHLALAGLWRMRASLDANDLVAVFATRRTPHRAVGLDTNPVTSERDSVVFLGINWLVRLSPLRNLAVTVCVKNRWTPPLRGLVVMRLIVDVGVHPTDGAVLAKEKTAIV
jgi:hypothetical protein